jgi:hypothetical protein
MLSSYTAQLDDEKVKTCWFSSEYYRMKKKSKRAGLAQENRFGSSEYFALFAAGW